jgi:hypothetical protein
MPSFFKILLKMNAAIKNPIKMFIGAGAIAMEKGMSIIVQYTTPSNILTTEFFSIIISVASFGP